MSPGYDASATIRSVAERRAAALAARDAGALQALHHAEFRWTSHRGEVFDRDAYVAANTAGELVWHGQALEDTHVVLAGPVAVLTGVAVDDVERGGERDTFRMRVTQVWVRDGASWVLLAGHAGPRVD